MKGRNHRPNDPLTPPPHLYQMQPRSKKNRSGRTLLGWFVLGMGAAVTFLIIITPLAVRSLPPRVVVRLPPALQCLHSDFCREDAPALPTAVPPTNAAALLDDVHETPEADETPTPTRETIIVPYGYGASPTAAPTLRPDQSVLLLPTATPTPMEVAAAPPEPLPAAAAPPDLPAVQQLDNLVHILQLWNNCGPASISMAINYWGYQMDQRTAAAFLKPEQLDNNVTPPELAAFVNQEMAGLNAIYRYGGSLALLKQLLAAGFPVVVETGYAPNGQWFGHHRLLAGYSDMEGSFYILDPFSSISNENRGYPEFYEDFDAAWQQFNRVYVIVYPPAREGELAAMLGEDWDPTRNIENALATAQREIQQNPASAFAWFNLGSAFVWQGDYERAAGAYDQAYNLGTLPEHMLWYQFGPFEAYLNTNRPQDVLALTEANLNGSPYLEENHYYRGRAYMMLGDLALAEQEFQNALQDNKNFAPAWQALEQVRQSS